jgi:endoglycosylceramidase
MGVVLALVLGVLAGAGPALAEDPGLPVLRREGPWVVDEHDRVVLLRGVNVVWKAAPFVPPDVPGGLTDVDLERIAGHGFDVVRLGVAFEGLMPQKSQIDHTYLDAVEAVVDRIAAHGLYALIDVHQDLMGQPWGNGFPTWAIRHFPELEALEPNLGFPLNAVRPSHNLAWDHFWADGKLDPADPQGVVGYLTDAIGALADRLGTHPGLAGIEILNEAWAGTPVLTCATLFVAGCPLVDTYVQATWQRLTDRIRQAAPELLVWWEPASTWNLTAPSHLGSPPLTPVIADPQVGFAFHDYCAFGELSTYLGAPTQLQYSCDLYHDITWQNAATFKARTGLPQLVTEFGNIDDGVELERSLHRSDATFTGWQYWHYGAGFAPRENSSEPFTETQLRHLVRTYPVATAGTPGPMSFEPSNGEMRYSFTPRPASAPTEIAVSDVHYPAGYEVVVTGGRVTSAAGATRVTIESDAGATAVMVTVRRASSGGPTTSAATSPQVTELPATGASAATWPWAILGAAALAGSSRRRLRR